MTRVVVRSGASFATRDQRARPRGRIGGASAPLPEETRARLLESLGLAARILEDSPIADADTPRDVDWSVAIQDLSRIDGAFAVAWREGKTLCLARDPIGHRTLYYALVDGALVFASRVDALLDAFALPRRADPRSVAAFLSYAYVPGRATMIEGVCEVLPGEIVRFDGSLSRTTFWRMPREGTDDVDLVAHLRRELERVIGGMLPAGEPVCASLSGGIDSSLVAALAKRLHDAPVRTFSITFGDAYRDELAWSSMVASHAKTDHTIVELPAEAIAAHLDDTVARLDKPNGDPLTVPNALLFREMAEHGTVVLNGEGGDPCFGGPKNMPMLLAELYGDGYEEDGGERARQRTYLRAHLKCFDELAFMLDPEVYRLATTPPLEDDLSEWFDDPRWPSFLGKLMAINVRFKGGHHILPKVDALAAPFGVLPRSPLFDKALVELAFAIPSRDKLRGSIEKYALKEAVRDLLPEAILDRPKSGMLVPVEGWFSGPMLPFARERILEGLPKHGLFQRDALEQLVTGKLRGLRPRRGVKIWLLLTLESHLRALGATLG
ncbi:MAG: asparagine synthase-related protein [Rubrivivax sp.]